MGAILKNKQCPNCLGRFERYPEGDCSKCQFTEFCKLTKTIKDKGVVDAAELNDWISQFHILFKRHPAISEFASAFKGMK